MSSLGAWLWGTSQLDDAIDKATSELLPAGAEDIVLNFEICDQIRSKSVSAKDAMRALKRRLNHKNPNVQLLALSLTDVCVKNGGDLFLTEIASREFIDNLVSILKIPALNIDVKNKILRVIQNWSLAFEGKPNLTYVGQVHKTLVKEGYKFPPKDLVVTNSAMVDTQTAPEWIDSDVCLRCRTAFSFANRKHHCRNCGQVFDQRCSSKTSPLPHFGVAEAVRVCDGCYSKLTKVDKADKHNHRHSSTSRQRSAQGLADAELQRAIELSLQEVGAPGGYVPSQTTNPNWRYSEPPIIDQSSRPDRKVAEEDEDPDLKAAIEASLREASAPKPSAPIQTPTIEEQPYSYSHTAALPKVPSFDLEPMEADAILTFNQTVEQVQAQGGRDIAKYPGVTELYERANSLRPKLATSLNDAGRKEEILSEMHDKLSQAVKLYDQILTEQVAQPRWKVAPTMASPSTAYQYAQQNLPSPLANGTMSPVSYSLHHTPTPNPTMAMQNLNIQSPVLQHPAMHTFTPAQFSEVPPAPQLSPSLQRHNTVSYSTVPQQPPNNASLARSHTLVSHSQAPYQRHRPQGMQQPYAPPPPPVSLSQFPVAPTSAPQSFPMYGPSVPTGIEQKEERQEALLIDL